ncbi:MAG: MurR/RpiR family transcriptional regulator [Erysipelotrichaceae bacterium]|nr:MurR/RpiR family transcriptional regulator [Erysipelotrichaceae bacterium]
MIIEKLKDEDNLTESEKQIAHYLLDDTNHIDHMTSTELAKAAFTSQSTVVRLYQKLNFKSFREFMTILAIERKDYLQSEKIYEGNPFEKMTSYDNTKNIVNEIFENTLTNTNMALDRNTITRICNRILNSQVIEIYAIGSGQTTASYFQRELLTVGKQCIVLGNIDDEYFNKIKDSNLTLLSF